MIIFVYHIYLFIICIYHLIPTIYVGHDYCNYGEPSLSCDGCDHIPPCVEYTKYGVELNYRKPHTRSENMNKVVMAVQEWMIEENQKQKHQQKINMMNYKGENKLSLSSSIKPLHLYHTYENFTRKSLSKDGLDYDLVITTTYNPSWYFIKP